nr:unnamed protein product [Digitaria exilis]
MRSLRGLRYVDVLDCPRLPLLERLLSQGYDLCAGLEWLDTDDFSFLTTSFCQYLTSLQRLAFHGCNTGEVRRLTDEQERALQLLTSLQELRFGGCEDLEDLPVGLHRLYSLKKLEIAYCQRISSLSEKDLPPSLEELEIWSCSEELTDPFLLHSSSLSKRLLPTAVLISLQRAGIMDILVKIARAISDALRDPEKLPMALILCGIVEAAAALSLVFFRVPGGGPFLGHHHGDKQALVYVYYGILGAVVAFGIAEAFTGLWVSGEPSGRRTVGMTVFWFSILPLVIVAGLGGGLSSATSN